MKKYLCLLLTISIIVATVCSCSKRDYGEEYNYETDCQYSYYDNIISWQKIQSDGDGQYILKNKYIYYYNTEKKTMTPLCNKSNCLHDMESDKDRLDDCNAYAPTGRGGTIKKIQYNDGYIYYFRQSNDLLERSLYRVSEDGSKKDKLITIGDEVNVDDWLIHRGNLYYVIHFYYADEIDQTKVNEKFLLKSLKLSSKMNEKNAKVIYESDEKYEIITLYQLQAYKNYLSFKMLANQKDVEWTTPESWYQQTYAPTYIYNIETEQTSEIPMPKGYSSTTGIASVTFLEDKMLFKLYDNLESGEYKLPVYSMNYDLTDQKIWLNAMEQDKLLQSYDDYVVISDAQLRYETTTTEEGLYTEVLKDGERPNINVEIYSSDAKRVSNFVYPMNVGSNFNGFGPDGVNVEFGENAGSWSVYQLNFKDVLNCHGEEVQLEKVSTRRYGALNKED